MTQFKRIDPAEIDLTNARLARKCARVRARQVTRVEEVASIMEDGFRETMNEARPGDYIVQNPTGEQYVTGKDEFEQRYRQTEQQNVYEPISRPVRVVELNENVCFEAPWGEEMRIKAGGVLILRESGEIYGIQRDEFQRTYEYVD